VAWVTAMLDLAIPLVGKAPGTALCDGQPIDFALDVNLSRADGFSITLGNESS